MKTSKQNPILNKIKLQCQAPQSSEGCNFKLSKQALTFAVKAWQSYMQMEMNTQKRNNPG